MDGCPVIFVIMRCERSTATTTKAALPSPPHKHTHTGRGSGWRKETCMVNGARQRQDHHVLPHSHSHKKEKGSGHVHTHTTQSKHCPRSIYTSSSPHRSTTESSKEPPQQAAYACLSHKRKKLLQFLSPSPSATPE